MPPLLNPGDCCAGHQILRPLAAGRSSEVHLARVPSGDLRAFKIMTAPGAPEKRRARFAQEGVALARIVHPNVVRVYDAGTLGDRAWLSLELFEGETLAQWLRGGCRPIDDLLNVVQQVCDGLAEAHRVGIVHRDLTPDNVLVGPGGMVKVIDFGMAKFDEFGVQTTQEQQIGLARYLAPECLRGAPVDARADVYSIGHILYQAIGGQHAMGDEPRTPIGTIQWQLRGQARPLRDLAPWVSTSLATLVHQMLEKDPGRRPTSALEVHARLREERAHLRAPQLRAARNAAPVDRHFAFAPTVPMPVSSEPDRAAMLPAAWPVPVSAAPPPAPPHLMIAPIPPAPAEARSTDAPVESAARRPSVVMRRAPAAAIAVSVVLAGAASAAWMLLGRDPTPTSAPRPAAAPSAPAPSAAPPTASASAAPPPASARPRAPASRPSKH